MNVAEFLYTGFWAVAIQFIVLLLVSKVKFDQRDVAWIYGIFSFVVPKQKGATSFLS